MAELRNCPFCGGEASIIMYRGSEINFYIECKDCKALMGNPRRMISAMKGKLYFENKAELIEAWNTRKPMETMVAELEALRSEKVETIGGYCQSTISKAIEIVRNGGKERGFADFLNVRKE